MTLSDAWLSMGLAVSVLVVSGCSPKAKDTLLRYGIGQKPRLASPGTRYPVSWFGSYRHHHRFTIRRLDIGDCPSDRACCLREILESSPQQDTLD